VIGEILGEVCDAHPADPSYCMELPSGRVLEPSAPFRFLNHSCDPNCELFYWCDEDDRASQEDRLWLQTIHDVQAGEELLIDYCWPADAAIPCRCGAPNCRGWIVDPDEWHLIPAPTTPREASPANPPEVGQPELGRASDAIPPRSASGPGGAASPGGLPPSPRS
jgi:hypothetical protein